MRRTVDLTAVVALAATLTMAACTEQALPTDPAASPQDAFFTEAPAPGYGALLRNAPLHAELSATGTIGPEGGRIELAAAGITFVVPRSALSETTRITVRALSGRALAFEFAPHGLEFAVPASVHLRASGTAAEDRLLRAEARADDGARIDGLMGVYFDYDAGFGAQPLENIETYLLDGSIVFDIRHFSGYAVASG